MTCDRHLRSGTWILALFFAACISLGAQQNPSAGQKSQALVSSDDKPANATEALQKATQNPVANLISVPLQDNSNFSVGPYDGGRV